MSREDGQENLPSVYYSGQNLDTRRLNSDNERRCASTTRGTLLRSLGKQRRGRINDHTD